MKQIVIKSDENTIALGEVSPNRIIIARREGYSDGIIMQNSNGEWELKISPPMYNSAVVRKSFFTDLARTLDGIGYKMYVL